MSSYNVPGQATTAEAHAASVDPLVPTGHVDGHHPHLAHHFDTLQQQKDAATLGMWAFLATEVMFFGGAIFGYCVYRAFHPEAFAVASSLENWVVGGFNTFILLCSSLTVALAVHAAQQGNNRMVTIYYAATILAAVIFVGVKGYEYSHLYHEGLFPGAWNPHPAVIVQSPRIEQGARIFYSFYFAMTGLHALHMVIGIGIMIWVISLARKNVFSHDYYNPVEISGLYWHFVDIVWIFLYPLLYLIAPAPLW